MSILIFVAPVRIAPGSWQYRRRPESDMLSPVRKILTGKSSEQSGGKGGTEDVGFEAYS